MSEPHDFAEHGRLLEVARQDDWAPGAARTADWLDARMELSSADVVSAYRAVVLAAKELADAVNGGKFTRATESLLPKLDRALAAFRNVGGEA